MERPVLFLCLFSFLMFAEGLSWFTAGGLGPCLVKPEHSQQAANNNEHQDCPTFFAGSFLVFERGFEWIKRDDNDKAVVAGFTIVLGVSTIGLWLATNKLWRAGERQLKLLGETSAAQSRDMQASVATSTAAVEVARQSFLAEHGTWLKIYPTVIGPVRFTNGKISMEVTIEAENIGSKPAIGVHLGCSMFRSKGYGIGEQEVSASLDQTKFYASLGRGLSRDLLPDEKMNIRFGADPEAVPRLEERVRDQIAAGVPEGNFKTVLSVAFSAIWKSTVSNEWRHSTSAVVITVKGKGAGMDLLDGEIPSDQLSCILVSGESQLAG